VGLRAVTGSSAIHASLSGFVKSTHMRLSVS
jgi:hypothetical protein